MRRDNRSDTAIDELQAVGRHNAGTCREVEDITAPGHTRRQVETARGESGHDVHGCDDVRVEQQTGNPPSQDKVP